MLRAVEADAFKRLAAPVAEILQARALCDDAALDRAFTVLDQTPAPPLSRQKPAEAVAVARFGEALFSLGLLAPGAWADALAERYALPRTDRAMLNGDAAIDDPKLSRAFFVEAPALLLAGEPPTLATANATDKLAPHPRRPRRIDGGVRAR